MICLDIFDQLVNDKQLNEAVCKEQQSQECML